MYTEPESEVELASADGTPTRSESPSRARSEPDASAHLLSLPFNISVCPHDAPWCLTSYTTPASEVPPGRSCPGAPARMVSWSFMTRDEPRASEPCCSCDVIFC